eukprot:COSAG06_NODE_19832_length_820_cov_1.317614_1_plen_114_part_00
MPSIDTSCSPPPPPPPPPAGHSPSLDPLGTRLSLSSDEEEEAASSCCRPRLLERMRFSSYGSRIANSKRGWWSFKHSLWVRVVVVATLALRRRAGRHVRGSETCCSYRVTAVN